MTPVIELDRDFFDEIVRQAREEFPNEACGLIAAVDGKPAKLYTMRNADASPVTYRLDPKEQLKVFNDIDERGWELWAIYHSHTHSQAYPSETDRRQAFYPEARYLILSLENRDDPVLRGFRIVDGEVSEEEVVLR
jgi:[CysO sulfur-carrier protein]-S-L-cysteine hydrolase